MGRLQQLEFRSRVPVSSTLGQAEPHVHVPALQSKQKLQASYVAICYIPTLGYSAR